MDWTAIVVAGGSLLITGIGVVLWFLYLSVREDAKAANAAAVKNANEADRKYDALKSEFADYKVYAENHFVTEGTLTRTIDGLNRAIESLTTSIRDMSTSFSAKLDSLHQRLDSKVDKP